MIDLTVARIAEIVGGELADITPAEAARTHVTGTVEFDSRAVTSGALFLALLLSILSRAQLPVIVVAGLVTIAATLAVSATSGILLGMLAGAVTGLVRR